MKEKIKETLFELIRIKSVDGNFEELKKVADFAEGYLKNAPVIKRWERNGKHSIYASLSEFPRVVFVGHLDVVDAEDKQFNPVIEGDSIYGRGALDMKGPDAVMLELARTLIDSGKRPAVAFLFTTDEEVGSEDGVEWLLKKDEINAEFAVIPDGGENFNLVVAGKGVLHFKVSCRGKATHGSRVWEGENAIEKCIKIYGDMKHSGLFPQEPCNVEDHWHNTINLGKLVGGDSVNRVPDHAEMYIDTRFVKPYTVKTFKERLLSFVPSDAEFEVISYGEPVETPLDNPYLLSMKESVREVIGREPGFVKEHGATDARFFEEKGIHSVILYPVGGNIHGKDEWVSLDSLVKLYNIFERFVEKALG